MNRRNFLSTAPAVAAQAPSRRRLVMLTTWDRRRLALERHLIEGVADADEYRTVWVAGYGVSVMETFDEVIRILEGE